MLIDADPQGNATATVGYDEPDTIEDNGILTQILKWESHCIFVQLLKCLYKCSKAFTTIRFVGA